MKLLQTQDDPEVSADVEAWRTKAGKKGVP